MAIEKAVIGRIKGLVNDAWRLSQIVRDDTLSSGVHARKCRGLIVAALHIVQKVVANPDNSYLKVIEDLATNAPRTEIGRTAGEIGEILSQLLVDIQAGLLSSVADHARAEVFDSFLDHAKLYLDNKHSNRAGVIAGVVFEDSIRRICRIHQIEEQGSNLDQLISDLVKAGILSEVKAKRARTAADVRNKATHAQWDKFDEKDVAATVEITEELIRKHIDEQV